MSYRYLLPIDGKWREVYESDLRLAERGSAQQQADAAILRALIAEYQKNPLAYFLPHGPQADFINDTDIDFSLLLGSNQAGKTYALLAWLAVRIVPCDPSWPCFTKHGLRHIEWEGPKRAMLASYEMNVHCRRNLWPKLLKILPRDELQLYSPEWAREHGKHPRPILWRSTPQIELRCGSTIDFFSYEQQPQAWESMTYDLLAADEQIPEELFDAARMRGLTAQHWQGAVACTPHKIKGLAYTGGRTWIRRVVTGEDTKGMKHRIYKLKISDVPDVIVPKETKERRYKDLVADPLARGDMKRYRRGLSRWNGDFEDDTSLVYDNWNRAVHWIDPFPIPAYWTRVRGVDPGRVHPFGVLWAAISPEDDLVFYREYYEAGLGMADNVRNVITASGNERIHVGTITDSDGNVIARYEECMKAEEYLYSVMDPRNFKHPAQESTETVGEVYARLGLNCIAGSGMHNVEAVPIVREYFELVPGRKHILERLKLRENMGDAAPRAYVFNTLTVFRGEIESYMMKEDSEDPEPGNDHLMTAMKYLILEGPRYMGPDVRPPPVRSARRPAPAAEKVNPYTGWVTT